ncbi:MAG TPA: DUF805 domain-containing protein [Ferruginibacter sp.]|nr:DUF805 domain-containing protein [Ferruginibacter sp.]
MFKNPFSFNGRIRRTEYCLSIIIYVIVVSIIQLIASRGTWFAIIAGLGAIPLVWFLIAQGAKRCHDRGNSGWYQIIPFYSLWMMFANSEHGINEYGLNPKGIGNTDEIDEIGKEMN